jgi:hypothetical protein
VHVVILVSFPVIIDVTILLTHLVPRLQERKYERKTPPNDA